MIGLYIESSELGLQTHDSILNKKSFVAGEHMHNSSYIGGLIGLCIAVIWQLFSLKAKLY